MSPTQRTSELEPCGCTQDRLSTGNGRVYLIVVKATDAGGTGFGTATAAVPTSSSSTNMAAVNAEAAAAKTAADANHGTRRGGYSVVGDRSVVGLCPNDLFIRIPGNRALYRPARQAVSPARAIARASDPPPGE
jgi:hypothetical protein